MRAGVVIDAARGACVVPRAWAAYSVWDRMRGLLGRPPLEEGEGLWIEPCGVVHTFGMRYPLDLAFIDREGRVCKFARDVAPGRFAGTLAARSTLELRAGALAATGLQLGDVVKWRPQS